LAKQARRLLNLMDDTPIVPGDAHPPFERTEEGRQILNDAEDELRNWQPNVEPIHSTAGSLGVGAMPGASMTTGNNESVTYGSETGQEVAYREKSPRSRSGSGERYVSPPATLEGGQVQQPYMTEAERRQVAEAGVI
jgi:hypothetical protein